MATQGDFAEASSSVLSRVRYFRACDRCRSRKVKCDNAMPCNRCKSEGRECTFSQGVSKRLLNSESEQDQIVRKRTRKRKSPSPVVENQNQNEVTGHASHRDRQGRRRLRSDSLVLLADKTTHWFSSSEGAPRFAGSTSGMPLLETTRLQRRAKAKHPTESAWNYLALLLQVNNDSTQGLETALLEPEDRDDEEVEEEFFPGRTIELRNESSGSEAYMTVIEIIPVDLLVSLVTIFFDVVHPTWPILHQSTIYTWLTGWRDATFGALVVSMCMLASRYSSDPRVLAEPFNAASAGMHYHPLFKKLLDVDHHNDVYEIVALFYASQFFCMDNIPQPLGLSYFGMAFAFCVDSGFHRDLPRNCRVGPIVRELRNRIAWAIYCWDKLLGTICGRPAWIPLEDIDCELPHPYPFSDPLNSGDPLPLAVHEADIQYVETFTAFIGVSAVLNFTLRAVHHRPLYPSSAFLNRLAMRMVRQNTDEEALQEAADHLEDWRSQIPQGVKASMHPPDNAAWHSVAVTEVSSTEALVRLLIAARRLQLCQAEDSPGVHNARAPVIGIAKDMIAMYVQVGSNNQLHRCTSVTAYKILLAARLLIACHIGASAVDDQVMMNDCQRAVQASSVLLRILSNALPITFGASEVLDETSRICGVEVSPMDGVENPRGPMRQKAWYRSFKQNANALPDPAFTPSDPMGGSGQMAWPFTSPSDVAYGSSEVPFNHASVALQSAADDPPMAGAQNEAWDPLQMADFDWLFPSSQM
ncbi:uncharacterized protein I303_104771 [Kwoniella dejecticola CBS 10117]|uniref:Zn(2)-C6 fungal-type domain-containing protein n=1 Tax=Kwoniella dejecticola CBS 10117 TaxID=1296121 RepID=A0A1A6A4D4_9TREE|nr:uncharacterized protein I303_04248 [Kwoniella dejecticola CBS 10117]OBR84925.1 hypothetical protein I303_04248 [Kwoniella dejecticola CBS 10117]